MLRRNFDASPRTRLLQASVLIAFAAATMMLAFYAENGTSRKVSEMAALSTIVAP